MTRWSFAVLWCFALLALAMIDRCGAEPGGWLYGPRGELPPAVASRLDAGDAVVHVELGPLGVLLWSPEEVPPARVSIRHGDVLVPRLDYVPAGLMELHLLVERLRPLRELGWRLDPDRRARVSATMTVQSEVECLRFIEVAVALREAGVRTLSVGPPESIVRAQLDRKGLQALDLCLSLGLRHRGRQLDDSSAAELLLYPTVADLEQRDLGITTAVLAHGGRAYPLELHQFAAEVRPSAERDRATVLLASSLVLDWVSARGLPTDDCLDVSHLELIEVARDELNDTSRFTGWQRWAPGATSIDGLFEPHIGADDQTAIVFHPLPSPRRDQVLAHETAHYWYHRLCLGRKGIEDTEAFAKGFEARVGPW